MSRPKKIVEKTEAKKIWAAPNKAEAEEPDEVKATQGFSAEDKVLLEKQENVIASNVGAFLLLGEALSVIKQRDLQKVTDPNLSFDEYCSKRWGFGKAYAYRLIAGYACVKNLKTKLIPSGIAVFPANEAQVRPLVSLSDEDQVKAWSFILKKADGGGITSALIEKILGGKADKPVRSRRISKTNASAKAEQKKLRTITKLVEKALEVDPSERTIKQLSDILEKIQDLVTGN